MDNHILDILDTLFLIVFSIFFFINDPIKYNYTGLLNKPHTHMFATLLCFVWILLLFSHLYPLLKRSICSKPVTNLIILLMCILCTVFTPYASSGDLLSQLHLLFALIAMIDLHWIFLHFIHFNQNVTLFYIACLLLSGAFVLTFSAITGISEWIFIVGSTIALNRLYSYKK